VGSPPAKWDAEALRGQLESDRNRVLALQDALEVKYRRRRMKNIATWDAAAERNTKRKSLRSVLKKKSREDCERAYQYQGELAMIDALLDALSSPEEFAEAADKARRYYKHMLKSDGVESFRRGLERRFWPYQAWLAPHLARSPEPRTEARLEGGVFLACAIKALRPLRPK